MKINHPDEYITAFLTKTSLPVDSHTEYNINSRNLILTLTDRDSEKYIAKISPDFHRGELEFESAIIRELQTETTMPLPEITEFHKDEFFSYLISPFYESKHMDWSSDTQVVNFIQDVAKIMYQIHLIHKDQFEDNTGHSIRTAPIHESITSNTRATLRELAYTDTEQYAEPVLNIERELLSYPLSEERLRVMHGDIHLPNLILNEDGSIYRLLDFEMLKEGDICFDFGKLFSRTLHLYEPYTNYSLDEMISMFFEAYPEDLSTDIKESAKLYCYSYTIKSYGRVQRSGMYNRWVENPLITDDGVERYKQMADEVEEWAEETLQNQSVSDPSPITDA